MDKPENDDFTLSFDAKDDGGAYTGDVLEKKVESLGWKLTLLTIIVPCLIAVIVIMAYFGITKKVSDYQVTGSAEVRQLTDMYEEKLSAMRKTQETFLRDINTEVTDIKKKMAEFEKKVGGGLKTVESKVDKIAQPVETLRRDVDQLNGRLAAVDKKAAETSQSVDGVRAELKLTGVAVDTLRTEKADKGTVDQRLAETNDRLNKSIQSVQSVSAEWGAGTEALFKRLESLEKRLAVLEKSGQQTGSVPPVEQLPGGRGIVEEDL